MTRPANSIAPRRIVALALVLGAAAQPWSPIHSPANAAQPANSLTTDSPPADDGSFQVTIEVYEVTEDGQQKLFDRHLVLFKGGKAYDFALLKPRDVTLIDPAGSKVTLLSRDKQVQSSIANQDLVAAAARVRLYAKNQGIEERLGINAKPDAQPDENYQISFTGIQYDATTAQPTMPMQPAKFAEFTDWVARVNLIRKLGTPPFARMTLGRTIATDGLVPSTITLSLKSKDQSRTFLSRYTFKSGLSVANQDRLDEVAGMISLYKVIPSEAFPK